MDARAQRFVPTDCPEKVAKTYLLGREGNHKLPILMAITMLPFCARTARSASGPATIAPAGCYSSPIGLSRPSRKPQAKRKRPTRSAYVDRMISSFPFVTPADHSVALAAILTALDRRSMATSPLFALTTPTAGTGKSLLIDLVAIIAIGRFDAGDCPKPHRGKLEKRLGAALLAETQ